MRSVLSISLPASKKKEIEERARKSNQSTSSYILRVVELEQKLISEDEILQMAKSAELNYKLGKTKKLKSLADLMK